MANLKNAFLIFLILNFCNSTSGPNFNISYKTITLDVNPSSERRENVAIVKKRDERGITRSFTKYVLFGTDRNEYFNVSSVVLGDEKVLVSGKEMAVNYVYDVYTYWKRDQILVIAFRYYYAGPSSYYKYYKRVDKDWKPVEVAEFGGNGYGFINTENLTKLLNVVELENPKPPVPEPVKEAPKSSSKKYTIIAVSAVVISLLVLMLVGLAFYFFK